MEYCENDYFLTALMQDYSLMVSDVNNDQMVQFASSVPKGCKSGFVTYRHHVVQQAKLQLVVTYCFWLVPFYPIEICS